MDARPCRGAGGKEGGALSPKAPREVWTARRSEPYLGDAEGCVDREGSFLTGRWAAPVSASFRNPWKVAGLKTTVLPCSWGRFLPD